MYVTNEGEVNLEEQQTNHQQSFHNFPGLKAPSH